jgi:ISXO2-like transposase domain
MPVNGIAPLPSRDIGTKRSTFYTQQTQPILSLPGVHVVASLLKRWFLGTHQGSITARHLDAYLDDFAFRFNRRHSRKRGMLFYRLLENTVATIYAYADWALARYPLTTTGGGYSTKAATPLFGFRRR